MSCLAAGAYRLPLSVLRFCLPFWTLDASHVDSKSKAARISCRVELSYSRQIAGTTDHAETAVSAYFCYLGFNFSTSRLGASGRLTGCRTLSYAPYIT